MFKNKPIGYGLATIGPGSYYTDNSMIADNWYLLTAVNSGILGLLLFLIIWLIVVENLISRNEKYSDVAILSSIAILVQILFLDTFAESGMYVLLMFLIALGLRKKKLTCFWK